MTTEQMECPECGEDAVKRRQLPTACHGRLTAWSGPSGVTKTGPAFALSPVTAAMRLLSPSLGQPNVRRRLRPR